MITARMPARLVNLLVCAGAGLRLEAAGADEDRPYSNRSRLTITEAGDSRIQISVSTLQDDVLMTSSLEIDAGPHNQLPRGGTATFHIDPVMLNEIAKDATADAVWTIGGAASAEGNLELGITEDDTGAAAAGNNPAACRSGIPEEPTTGSGAWWRLNVAAAGRDRERRLQEESWRRIASLETQRFKNALGRLTGLNVPGSVRSKVQQAPGLQLFSHPETGLACIASRDPDLVIALPLKTPGQKCRSTFGRQPHGRSASASRPRQDRPTPSRVNKTRQWAASSKRPEREPTTSGTEYESRPQQADPTS